MNSDEAAIRRVVERWIEAARSGEVDAVLELMAPTPCSCCPVSLPCRDARPSRATCAAR